MMSDVKIKLYLTFIDCVNSRKLLFFFSFSALEIFLKHEKVNYVLIGQKCIDHL